MSRRFKTPAEFNDTELRKHDYTALAVGLLTFLVVLTIVVLLSMAKGTVAK